MLPHLYQPIGVIAGMNADALIPHVAASIDTGVGGTGGGYDAVQSRGRRKQPVPRTTSEDWELRPQQRRQLAATHRDLQRNFAIVAWAIRQHLDYVSTFTFRCKSGDDGFDADVEAFIAEWSKPENCDPGGRHRLSRLVRMWEMRRVLDGDVLKNHLSNGMVQTIEGDRIQSGGCDFASLGINDPENVINGVYVDPATFRARGYAVFKRPVNGSGLVFDTMVPAQFSDLFGYFDRYDQVRGISPLAAAANSFRDVYENFDFALVKAKVAQMMAFAVYRETSEALGTGESGTSDREPYEVDFNRGPVIWDMDPGDRAEVLESRTPATEFQAFMNMASMVALKALDIPFSFFDESHTNYSGARLAGINYEKSAGIKREDNREGLDRTTDWRLRLAIVDGRITPPRKWRGDLRRLKWEWAHTGMPWYDPVKEVAGAVAAVAAGFSSPQRECKKLGQDFFELIDERAAAEAYARDKGVAISTDVTALAAIAQADAKNGTDTQAGKNTGARGRPSED